MKKAALLAAIILAIGAALPLVAQTGLPLNQRVLVVYNANVPDSLAVANYYMTRRSIPAANRCAIAPPSTTYVTASDFDNTVKAPIKGCLNAVGPGTILYIVFTYQTPYGRIGPDGNGYALDQSIADIWDQYNPQLLYPYPDNTHPYYAGAQTQGNVYPPFVSLADYRNSPGALTLYSVWRLDAATLAIAEGLVDKAIQAETSGLRGQACFDRNRGDLSTQFDGIYFAGDWDLHNAALFASQAGFAVTEDPNDAEFGTAPAPLRCDNAALYSGWYTLSHYNDAFTWNTGAIGFHLDSDSAVDPRGGPSWSANALLKGITMTSGAVQEPYLEGLPHPDGVFRNLFEGANVGDAFLRNTAYLKWMIINMGDPLYRPFPAGFPVFNQTTNPQTSLPLNPQYLVGGGPSTGTVMLAADAPAGGAVVSLLSNNLAATVPPSVTVPQGSHSAKFPITTSVVTTDTYVQISASSGVISRTNTLGVLPLLGLVTVTPASVTGPATVAGTVYLNDQAPPGGVLVNFNSGSSAVTVPSNVQILAGAVSATFNIGVTAVASGSSVVISALSAGSTQTATLNIAPGSSPALSVSPSSLTFAYQAGAVPQSQTIVVASTGSNFGFTGTASPSWLSVSPQSGSTPANLQISVSSGLSPGSYSGTVVLSATGGTSATVTVTLSVSAPALSDSTFITRLYQDILARAPDPAGFSYWQTKLSGGETRGAVADEFLRSPEYAVYGLFIVSNYLGVLGREPEFGGYQYWFAQMRIGGKQQIDVINGFFASPEYQARFGNPDVSTFVTELYRNVLSRNPDAGGFQYWTTLLNTGQMSRPQVVQGFVTSAEFQATTLSQLYVELAYFALLNRAASPTELSAGKQALAAGQSTAIFLGGIVNGPEFLAGR